MHYNVILVQKETAETETWFSNMEREMLAVIHSLEKLHYYVYGWHVIVETDHRLLEAILIRICWVSYLFCQNDAYDMEIRSSLWQFDNLPELIRLHVGD